MTQKIKICGITREADAEYALALGADFLGVILFQKSPRGVELERAGALLQCIPEGKRVCVDVNPGTDEMQARLDLGFDFFQIHCPYETGLETLAGWSGAVGRERLWIAPKLPPGKPYPQGVLEFADTIVYDAFSRDPLLFGGTGIVADWERFQEWSTGCGHKSWVLAGGLNPDNLKKALEATAADVYDVNSGVESAPGIKDPKKLDSLFQQWRNRQ